MKNLLLICFCMLSAMAYTQRIMLHTTFMPLRVYHQNVTQKFHMVISYSGSDSLMKALKEKGVENPMMQDRGTAINSVITTGAYNNKSVMPIELTFLKAEDKDGKIIIPKNTKMLGLAKENAMPVYDSVVSDEMDSAAKAQFLQSFRNILSQIFLPDKRMAVGDTFTMTSPLNFPAGLVNIKMIFSTTYKLISVKNNAGHFTIAIKYTLNMGTEQVTATGGGSGSGIMDVDLKNQYPLKYTSNYTMSISAQKNGAGIHVTLNGSSDSENTITRKM